MIQDIAMDAMRYTASMHQQQQSAQDLFVSQASTAGRELSMASILQNQQQADLEFNSVLNQPTQQIHGNRVSFMLGSTLQKQKGSRTTSMEGAEYGQILNNQVSGKVSFDSEETEDGRQHEIRVPPMSLTGVQEAQNYKQLENSNSQLMTDDSRRSSVKKHVLSLYAGKKQQQSDDFSNPHTQVNSFNNPNKNNKEEQKTPLSLKYANLIQKARRDISQNANNLSIFTKDDSKIQVKKRQSENQKKANIKQAEKSTRLQQLSHRYCIDDEHIQGNCTQKINQMYQSDAKDVKLENETNNPHSFNSNYDGSNSHDQSVISKLLKMEKAKKLLQIQQILRHNTKNQRMSSQKRETSLQKESLSTLILKNNQNSQVVSGNTTSRMHHDNLNKTASQINKTEVWSSPYKYQQSRNQNDFKTSKYSRSKQQIFATNNHRKTGIVFRNTVNKQHAVSQQHTHHTHTQLPKLVQQEEADTATLLSQSKKEEEIKKLKKNRHARVPLLSDPPVKGNGTNNMSQSLINPVHIFRQKNDQRHIRESSEPAEYDTIQTAPQDVKMMNQSQQFSSSRVTMAEQKMTRQQRSTHMRFASQASPKIRPSQISIILSPATSTNIQSSEAVTQMQHKHASRTTGHKVSNSQAIPLGISNFAAAEAAAVLQPQNQQHRIMKASFREQRSRLKQLIRKRQALIVTANQNNQSLDEEILGGIKQNRIFMNEIQCGTNSPCSVCDYCSSNSHDSIEDLRKTGQLSGHTGDAQDSIYNEQATKRSSKIKQKKKKIQVELEEAADLLRIQTQFLNPRSNSNLKCECPDNADEVNSFGSKTYNEQAERDSIALDMQTMQEMHESFKDQYPTATLNKNLLQAQLHNKSPSVIKQRQTHSTLYNNQYNLPDYMLSPSRMTKGTKQSQTSFQKIYNQIAFGSNRKDTPNLDLAHIEERISPNRKLKLQQQQSQTATKQQTSNAKKPKNSAKVYQNQTAGFPTKVAELQISMSPTIYKDSEEAESPLSNQHDHLKTHYMLPMQAMNHLEEQKQYGESTIQSQDIIDQERLVKISNDKVREARALAMQISNQEIAILFNQLEFCQSASAIALRLLWTWVSTVSLNKKFKLIQNFDKNIFVQFVYNKVINAVSFQFYS